jgi:hypothetical protein
VRDEQPESNVLHERTNAPGVIAHRLDRPHWLTPLLLAIALASIGPA